MQHLFALIDAASNAQTVGNDSKCGAELIGIAQDASQMEG
jgi:hypothetical protein